MSISIQSYLIASATSYLLGKGIEAAYLLATKGNLRDFEWFTKWDLLALIPGAFLTRVVKLPLQLFTKVGGKLVGKAFVLGGGKLLAKYFAQSFASTGGKLLMRAADGTIIELGAGASVKKGFWHLTNHLAAFWDGSVSKQLGFKTFWPSNTTPAKVVVYLQEAVSKYQIGGPADQVIKLRNGITTKLVIHNNAVTTFYPTAGSGVVRSTAIEKAFQ